MDLHLAPACVDAPVVGEHEQQAGLVAAVVCTAAPSRSSWPWSGRAGRNAKVLRQMVYNTTQLRLVVDAVGRGGTGTRTTIRLSVSSLSWILSAGSTVIVTRRVRA